MNDWQDQLIEYMIDGGLIGRKQSDILAKFDTVANAERINAELTFLAAEDKVQKYVVPPISRRGGRSYIVWRATTKIMEHVS
jgi:hypothetical protein